MGRRAKASFSYGFVLKNEELENLSDVLGCKDSSDLWKIAGSWLDSEDLMPFGFVAEKKYMEGPEDEDEELVISFVGRLDREPGFEPQELEIWGTSSGGMKYTTIPMPADKEFMLSAKEAFQKLKDSEVFKKAEITEIVPQWILMLSVG